MFIRPCHKFKNGKEHAYWALVESYRTERGPRQRVVSYLGKLKKEERLGVKQTAIGNRNSAFKQLHLFDTMAMGRGLMEQVVTIDKSFALRNGIVNSYSKAHRKALPFCLTCIIECDLAAVANFLVFAEKDKYGTRIF